MAYHKCQEAVAAGFVKVAHISGKMNLADILTKPLSPTDYYRFLKQIMFDRHQETDPESYAPEGEL